MRRLRHPYGIEFGFQMAAFGVEVIAIPCCTHPHALGRDRILVVRVTAAFVKEFTVSACTCRFHCSVQGLRTVSVLVALLTVAELSLGLAVGLETTPLVEVKKSASQMVGTQGAVERRSPQSIGIQSGQRLGILVI